MNPLTVDEVRSLLPEGDAVRPLLDRLIARASPDAGRRWAASGELGTVGSRLVDPETVADEIPQLLRQVRSHLDALYRHVLGALEAAGRGNLEQAMGHLLAAAEAEAGVGRIEEAEAFAAAAIHLTQRFRDRSKAHAAYLTGARIARARGRWKEAEQQYGKALGLARDGKSNAAAATAAIGLGNVAVDRGLWKVAGKRYDAAEEWVKASDRLLPEAWHLALNRSIVAREQGRLDAADEALGQAATLAEEVGELDGARTILENARGQLLRARERNEEAESAYRGALHHAEGPDARVTVSLNLADVLLAQGRTLEAGEIAREAEEFAIRSGVTRRLPEVYRILGRVMAARGHPDAFIFFEHGLEAVRSRLLPEFEQALILEAYGLYDLGRDEEAMGRARLEQARRIYEALECDPARERVVRVLEEWGADPDPDGESGTDEGVDER